MTRLINTTTRFEDRENLRAIFSDAVSECIKKYDEFSKDDVLFEMSLDRDTIKYDVTDAQMKRTIHREMKLLTTYRILEKIDKKWYKAI